jgi:hypothetical protein
LNIFRTFGSGSGWTAKRSNRRPTTHPQPLCAILRQTTDIQDNISIFLTENLKTKISSV